MKRKILILTFAILLVGVLSGCCLSHDWKEATCTAPKTCAKCQEVEGEALGHSWTPATCQAPETCTSCGLTQGEPLADHDWQEATCESPITCSMCRAYKPGTEAHTILEGEISMGEFAMEVKGVCDACGQEASSSSLLETLPVGIWKVDTVAINGGEPETYDPENFVLSIYEDGTYDQTTIGHASAGNWKVTGGVNGNLDISMTTLTDSGLAICYITGEDINVMKLSVFTENWPVYRLRRER